jgi:hypothetical protein
MKLLVESAIIFFGTLMAAGLVALGEPGSRGEQGSAKQAHRQAVNQLMESAGIEVEPVAADTGR